MQQLEQGHPSPPLYDRFRALDTGTSHSPGGVRLRTRVLKSEEPLERVHTSVHACTQGPVKAVGEGRGRYPPGHGRFWIWGEW